MDGVAVESLLNPHDPFAKIYEVHGAMTPGVGRSAAVAWDAAGSGA